MSTRYSGCGHLRNVLDRDCRHTVIQNAINILAKIKDQFDSIVISGYSQALIGPCVADALNKDIVVVRKKRDICASEFIIEGEFPGRYIIIDDLISSGNTLVHITKSLHFEYEGIKWAGLYLYAISSMVRLRDIMPGPLYTNKDLVDLLKIMIDTTNRTKLIEYIDRHVKIPN